MCHGGNKMKDGTSAVTKIGSVNIDWHVPLTGNSSWPAPCLRPVCKAPHTHLWPYVNNRVTVKLGNLDFLGLFTKPEPLLVQYAA